MFDKQRPLTEEQLAVLMSPLHQARVSNRSQGGRSLSYLEGWDVKATLTRVFGFGGWDSEVIETVVHDIQRTEVPEQGQTKAFTRVVVMATVTLRLTIHQTGTVYAETAAASQTGRDIGEVTDFAIKTAATDALKRCAINLGTQFGLSLYNQGTTNEVIQRIFAPGQEWPRGDAGKPTEQQQAVLNKSLGQLPERDINEDTVKQDGGTP